MAPKQHELLAQDPRVVSPQRPWKPGLRLTMDEAALVRVAWRHPPVPTEAQLDALVTAHFNSRVLDKAIIIGLKRQKKTAAARKLVQDKRKAIADAARIAARHDVDLVVRIHNDQSTAASRVVISLDLPKDVGVFATPAERRLAAGRSARLRGDSGVPPTAPQVEPLRGGARIRWQLAHLSAGDDVLLAAAFLTFGPDTASPVIARYRIAARELARPANGELRFDLAPTVGA